MTVTRREGDYGPVYTISRTDRPNYSNRLEVEPNTSPDTEAWIKNGFMLWLTLDNKDNHANMGIALDSEDVEELLTAIMLTRKDWEERARKTLER